MAGARRKAVASRAGRASKKSTRLTRRKKKAKPSRVKKVRMSPRTAFPSLAQADGTAVFVLVAEKMDGQWDVADNSRAFVNSIRSGRGGIAHRRGLSGALCRAMAAVGHPQRGQILCKLLEGPATYQSLQRLTKLKAGPLYHHVGELRLAGLMLPKQRDLYELTRAGRNVILAALALGSLVRDGRRRP